MNDPRVVRGNALTSNIVAYRPTPPNAEGTDSKKRTHVRAPIGSIYAASYDLPPERVDVFKYLVEEDSAPASKSVTSQTAKFVTRPKTPPYVPLKTGKDASTQIDDEDMLFDFDLEVEPLLEVLVSKTLDQSIFELEQETEMGHLQARKTTLLKNKRKTAQERAALEEAAKVKWRKMKMRKAKEVERLNQEEHVCVAAAAYSRARNAFAAIKSETYGKLRRSGYFFDVNRDFVERVFLPGVFEGVDKRARMAKIGEDVIDDILKTALRKLDETLEASRAPPETPKATMLRIFIQGEEFGEETGGTTVGPIALSPSETIADAEGKNRVVAARALWRREYAW